MSDKNRNMNDINDQKTAEQQAFSEEIRRRLAEPGSGKPTLDEFKVMVYKDREKRRKKRNALVACIVAAFIVGYLTYDDLVPEVGADKNPKETIQTEDGVIIEDGGWGSSTGEDENYTVLANEWELIEQIKDEHPQLLVPKYVTVGYIFKQLSMENVVNEDVIYEYVFSNGEGKTLEIEMYAGNEKLISLDIDNASRMVDTIKGAVCIQEGENKIATIQLDDGNTITIWGEISDGEIKKIVDGLE